MTSAMFDRQLGDLSSSLGVDLLTAQVGPSQLQRLAWRSVGFEHNAAAGAVLDGSGLIVATNATWRLFATLNGSIDGTTGEGVNYLETCARAAAQGLDEAQAVLVGLQEILAGERTSFDLEHPCPSPNQDRWLLLRATAAPVVDGAGLVLFHDDITARKIAEEALARRGNHDTLTGLGTGAAARAVLASRSATEPDAVVVISLGLDGFTAVNDSFGHHVGDEVLVQVANRIRRLLGQADLAFRVGGDEFLIVCAGPSRDDAERLAAQVRAQLAEPFQVGPVVATIGASTGVASGSELVSVDALLVEADAQMHRHKRQCRAMARANGQALVLPPAESAVTSWLTETELRAVQATTNVVLAHATDLVVFFKGDATIMWASPASERLFGLSSEDLVGRNGIDLVHPDDRDRVTLDLFSIPGRGDAVRTEFRVTVADGSVRWVEEIATNLLEDPDVGAVVGHIRDITDRKAAEEEVRFQARLLAAAGQAMVALDAGGIVQYWNHAAEELYGWTAAEALGRAMHELVPPAPGWADRAQEMRFPFEDGRTWSGELFVMTKSHDSVPVWVTGTPVLDPSGQQTATIIVSTDISERIARTIQAELDHQRLADAQASAGLGSFEIDLITGEVTRSDELRRIIGHPSDAVEIDMFDFVHPDDRAAVDAAVAKLVADGEEVSLTHRIVRPDGEIRWVISKADLAKNSPQRIAGTSLDITERHLAELALAHQANHDPLTGLANRRLLIERIETSLEHNLETGRRSAVLYIDLVDFEAINNRIGHAGGDTILRAVGELVEGALAPGDTLARLGGDEFVACCQGVAGVEGALEIVDRIRTALAAPFEFRSESLRVAATIGVAISHRASQADALLRDADAAMYVAKQGNRQVEVFNDAMSEQASRRRHLVAELDEAIAGGQIHTWFQPEVDLDTGEVFGFEALVRWHHPQRGIISPAEFIGLAEDSGLINQLGRNVLSDACNELARWMDHLPDCQLMVSVNVSPIQMAGTDLADDVRAAIAAAGVPPAQVCLEVTETSLMEPAHATEVLRDLKEIGVLIAIDDFGTGYSSLNRLKGFPVDFLKIDRSFVTGLGGDPEDELIVAAVTNLAHSMGIQVIAEGIETAQQRSILADMGCEFGQGYLWHRPMPPAEALAWAARQAPR